MDVKPVVLTIISPKELPPSPKASIWDRIARAIPFFKDSRSSYLGVFDAISCKFRRYPGTLIDQAGCERHAWEYLIFKDEKEAAKEGYRLGKLCYKHRIKVFWADGEDGWAGTGRFPRYPKPYRNMLAFIKAFRLAAPSYTKLAYNGYSWNRTSKATGARRLHDALMMRLFDIWAPMNYGTSSDTVEKHWNRKCFKYRTLQRLRVVPMIGVGRIDKSGHTWGDWDTHLHLLLSTPVDGVNFYFGNGARNQMFKGNARHKALIEAVPELKTEWGVYDET